MKSNDSREPNTQKQPRALTEQGIKSATNFNGQWAGTRQIDRL